ncbi:MAG: MFS transporter, partial [Gammaproteobacteria bacterium]|nr:MFS transporter [Gemmatimonadota bacterium]NIU77728.1 MFS transporter [Gammaproteobacteria bacterium]NIY11230.1 MFS transporter [Gemmatimonadota bacterium]
FPLLLAAAAATGLTFPQIGALVRARWARLHTAPRLSTAFAWESVLDEVVYVVGPLLAVFLATGVHPLGGLAAVLALTVGGGYAFAAQRATEPAVRAHAPGGARDRLPAVALAWMVAGFAFMGGIFGIL